jgi:hypothetical protein
MAASASMSVSAGEHARAKDEEYSFLAVLGAILGTAFFPFISVVVALVLWGRQPNGTKRTWLNIWFWASLAWLAATSLFVIFFGLAVSVDID